MNWIVKRAIRSVFTVVIVVNLSFVMIQQLPGGPMDYLISQLQAGEGSNMDPQQVEAIAESYLNVNPNEPFLVQYQDYMTSLLLEGDLGTSTWYNDPVAEILGNALPWTLFLFVTATILTFLIGIVLGAYMAYIEGSNADSGLSIFSVVTNSVPYYIVAIMFVYIIALQWGMFPSSGRMNPQTTPGFNYPFIAGVFNHAFLPILSLIVTGVGGWALAMRANSIRILGEDYLRVARLRGISSRRIITRYVGRNAILPLYTTFMINLGYVLGGSVVLEQIFAYRGVGYYLFEGVVSRDYPLMMGGFLLITIAVIVGVFISELTYGLLDPRAEEGGEGNETY